MFKGPRTVQMLTFIGSGTCIFSPGSKKIAASLGRKRHASSAPTVPKDRLRQLEIHVPAGSARRASTWSVNPKIEELASGFAVRKRTFHPARAVADVVERREPAGNVVGFRRR